MKQKQGAIIPWEHQRECLQAIARQRRHGSDRALFVMASGLGKTFTSAFEFKRFLRHHPGARLLFLAHQNDLLKQARVAYRQIFGDSLTYGLFHGHGKETRAQVTFATFQSVRKALFGKQRNGHPLFRRGRFDYIVVDESHHGQALTYRNVIDYFQPQFLLGMTATPDRMDMRDIREIFSAGIEAERKEVYSLDLEEALSRGLLTPVDYRVMADEIVDKGKLKVPPHLVTVKMLNRIFFARKRDEEIVKVILDRTKDIPDPRIIVFDASIKHANQFAGMFPGAVAIHSSVPHRERDERIDWVRRGVVRIAVTVDQFNEGIDIPEANVLVFLRSTQSPRIFRQQLGRGLRKFPGKARVLVLDFVANCERLTLLDELRQNIEKSRKVHHRRNRYGARETFSVDLGKLVFEERSEKIIELLRQAKLPLTKERLLQYLWGFYQKHGRAPVKYDLGSRNNMPSPDTYLKRFGSFVEACLLAGIPRKLAFQSQSSTFRLGDQALLDKLLAFYQKHGRAPEKSDLGSKNGMPSPKPYLNRFGGIVQARRLAGIPDDVMGARGASDQALLDKLLAFYQKHGRAPIRSDFTLENNLPSVSVYRNRFGGPLKACRLAGILEVASTKTSNDQVLLDKLYAFYKKHRRAPVCKDLGSKCQTPSANTYLHRFGGLTKACLLAGIPESAFCSGQKPVLRHELAKQKRRKKK